MTVPGQKQPAGKHQDLSFGGFKINSRELMYWLLPDKYPDKPKLTVERIKSESNVETRDLLIRMLGMAYNCNGIERFIMDGGGEVVDLPNPDNLTDNKLLRVKNIHDEWEYFIHFISSGTVNIQAAKLTKEQRKANGFTEEGYKQGLLGMGTQKDIDELKAKGYKTISDFVGYTYGLKPGQYKLQKRV